MNIHQPQRLIRGVEETDGSYFEKLDTLLSQDLDFHSQDSGYASHNFHSFPAKFPPQLPRKFIEGLTAPGDVVLDPMMGSGTTVLEAYLSGRHGVGFDIDPLALILTRAKVTPLNGRLVAQIGNEISERAEFAVRERRNELEKVLESRWDPKTRDFIDYWFTPETQIDLLALITEIEQIEDVKIRAFFELAFSAIIITKSGGVSLAFDLAHTRPHRAKVVIGRTGEVVLRGELTDSSSRRIKLLTKTLRSPFREFGKRVEQNLGGLPESESDRIQPYLKGLLEPEPERIEPYIAPGNAQGLPLDDKSVDLIVTSPPYVSNAIDYMRAHKFSLVWMGYPIDELGQKRNEYIGGEAVTDFDFEDLPARTRQVVADIADRDEKKGRVLHRYFSEMTRTLQEMFRVLKPGKAAIVVIGSSVMRSRDTETHTCLAEIGQQTGFRVPKIGVRNLDRNRRMMPAGSELDLESQIQQRMHEEYVIGFCKPEA
ncbi:MAG TPA: site-specific DNA-methyltransferase [Proteobacteria bacterium]|nr:site-specific DNA-methyltransferase [Pseudomonadota bacterium]